MKDNITSGETGEKGRKKIDGRDEDTILLVSTRRKNNHRRRRRARAAAAAAGGMNFRHLRQEKRGEERGHIRVAESQERRPTEERRAGGREE